MKAITGGDHGPAQGHSFDDRHAGSWNDQCRCADGTQFVVGFYDDDKRAFLQIDGEPVTLAKRLSVAGKRYSGAGITLTIGRTAGTTVKHLKRPVTACAVI
ncbi:MULTISPECIES: MliC family protein [Bradyrhizobium]|uniref:MliC family protein n=1 Tax=Bradyrhizobium TaxID=374 RepID=UPI0020137B3D|nr:MULTISPECIES: MliC family protein [Bradyrhizobium]